MACWRACGNYSDAIGRAVQAKRPSRLRPFVAKAAPTQLGGTRLNDVLRRHVQDLVERMVAEGLSPSTVRNVVMPLRAIYRRAIHRGEVAVNPTADLQLPKVIGKRDRVASPAEAEALIQALPIEDQAFWATAMYAGLRRGE